MSNPAGTNKLATLLPKRAPRGKVDILQEHIDEGIRRNSSYCAIAEAVKLAFPQASKVSVDLQTIRWSDREKGLRYQYLTPPIAQQYLLNFDDGIKCRPFSFNLRGAHTSTAQFIDRSGGKAKIKRRHRLGRKRILPPDDGKPSETFGGSPAPVSKSIATYRRFGLRAYTLERAKDITA